MKGKWVPIEEKTLLDAFEEEPSLYSDSDANYYNKSFKEEAWNRIIDKVNKSTACLFIYLFILLLKLLNKQRRKTQKNVTPSCH